MNLPMQNFDAYVFSKQAGYHEPTVRKDASGEVDAPRSVRCWPVAALQQFEFSVN